MAFNWGEDRGTKKGSNKLDENKENFTVWRHEWMPVTQEWQTEDSPSQPWTVSKFCLTCSVWFHQNSKNVPSIDHRPFSFLAYFPSLLLFSFLSTFMPQNAFTWVEKLFWICLPLGALKSSLLPGKWTLPICSPLLFIFWSWAFHYQVSNSQTLQLEYARQSKTGNATLSYYYLSWTRITAFDESCFSL